MNMAVAALTFVPLLMVSFAHFLWATNNTWPLRNEELLVQTVVGTAGATAMPNRFLIGIMAALVLIAGIVALALGDHTSGGMPLSIIGGLLALVFLARGVLSYTPAWRASHPVEPFATLDRRNYGPLCFWVAAGFAILVVLRVM